MSASFPKTGAAEVPASSTSMLTPDDVAELLQVSRFTLENWRFEGTGPDWFRIGRRIRYRKSDLDAWVDSHIREDLPRS
jgi:excisionase family DNA binding protein